jgi:lysozyme family protein
LLKRLKNKMANLWQKCKARRKISRDVKEILSRLQLLTERRERYKVTDIAVAMPGTASAVDLRLPAMYKNSRNLVGIAKC